VEEDPRTTLEIRISDDEESLIRDAADAIADEIRSNPRLLLCVATGESPRRVYELLARKKEDEPQLFDRIRILKLDEWGGLAMDDPASCEVYIRKLLIEPLGISENRTFGFRSDAEDPDAECDRIREFVLQEGPIDLLILGLGADGHIAMNMPAEWLNAQAHVEPISGLLRAHPMLAQARGEVRYGLTLGMNEIVQARKVFLIAGGRSKREPVQRLIDEGVSSRFPASFLWLCADVTCFSDWEAAVRIE